jgi:excisionase family DNA binding protein
MPKPFRLFSTRPLPPDAELVEHDGRPHVRLKERGRTVYYPLTKDGKGYLKPSKCWYFKYRDATGTVKRAKGFPDLKATEQLAIETERKVARQRLGYADPVEEHATRPLADHLEDYGRFLEGKGGTQRHREHTLARCEAVFRGCGFSYLRDINSEKVTAWILGRRAADTVRTIPPGDSFTPGEAAAVLGISRSALGRALTRHQLSATGNGKARRLPRSTVEALAVQQAKGISPATANHYVVALKAFGRWLVRTRRAATNPFDSLNRQATATDVRRRRRELTVEELRRLLETTRTSNRTFRGLTGVDRYCLYLTAVSTGIRANALANLTPADFDLNAPSPVVTVPARFSKNRRTHTVPLPADVAAELGPYLAQKAAGSPIWGGTWASSHRAAEMLRRDLIAADVPYAVGGPDGPEYADFHSLRHTYLTLGGRSGIDLRTLQELAGHSRPELTARYSHRRLYDLAGAVEKLPNLVPDTEAPAPDTSAAELRQTGTDDAPAAVLPLRSPPAGPSKADNVVRLGVPPGVPTGYAGPHQSALPCNNETVQSTPQANRKTLENKEPGAVLHRVASVGLSAPPRARTEDPLIKSQLLYQLS